MVRDVILEQVDTVTTTQPFTDRETISFISQWIIDRKKMLFVGDYYYFNSSDPLLCNEIGVI